MSHNIHNSKFISLRQPAWHGLGLVIQEEIDATEAGSRLGLPRIYTEAVHTESGLVLPDHKCIVGQELGKAPVPFSVVGKDYAEITHFDFLKAWDRATNKAPIETIGLLGKGETLFVTTKLPKFDVKGDEIDSYLLAYNPLTGIDALTGRETDIRVVCQNTLSLSASSFAQQLRVIHYAGAGEQLEKWLHRVWSERIEKQAVLKEAYAILAEYKPDSNAVIDVLEATYPVARQPEADEKTTEGLEKLAAWQRANERQIDHQSAVNNLFEGTGIGSDLKSARGTGWGLWNAVVEYEDYSKPRRLSSSTVFGAGADRKSKAFDEIYAQATN